MRIGVGLLLVSCSEGSQDGANQSGGDPRAQCTLTQARIFGGGTTPKLTGLGADQVRAIVSVSVTGLGLPPGSAEAGLCSGVVIAPGAVLTARHCLDRDGDGMADQEAEITVGRPDVATTRRGRADEVWLHPELDVALLEATWLEEEEDGIAPLPLNAEPLDEAWAGTPVELAGYGLKENPAPATLAFVVEEVARVEPSHVVVNGMGRSGACLGDSGGPLLGRTDDGHVRVLGVLDDGDPTCVGEDYYTRADRLTEWEPLSALFGDGSAAGGAPCEGLGADGTCMRGHAMYCENDQIHVDACGAEGFVCGWSSIAAGFRCVNIEEDPCGGLGSYARCMGDLIVSCVDGAPASVDCRDCSQTCVPWADGAGAGCR